MSADIEAVRQVASAANHLAIVGVTRSDGSVHASLVNAGVIDDPVTAEPSIGFVVGGDTTKLRLLRRSGRATASFQAGYRWVSVDGQVRIAGPDDLDTGVTAVDVPALLRDVFRAAGGTHENWAEFDAVMAAERRAAVFVRADRIIGIS